MRPRARARNNLGLSGARERGCVCNIPYPASEFRRPVGSLTKPNAGKGRNKPKSRQAQGRQAQGRQPSEGNPLNYRAYLREVGTFGNTPMYGVDTSTSTKRTAAGPDPLSHAQRDGYISQPPAILIIPPDLLRKDTSAKQPSKARGNAPKKTPDEQNNISLWAAASGRAFGCG